ncbi:MAG: SH3 domain-containing protein [Clostridia bacterium]|nr:SH3 domain-containing protein [Clostridia bacterium]
MKKIVALMMAAVLMMTAMAALAEQQVRATASVNLRYGPSRDAEKFDAVKPDTMLPYLDETQADERPVDWYKVFYNGEELWISSRYSELVDVDPEDISDASEWYQQDLKQAAKALGAKKQAKGSGELERIYANDALKLGGSDTVEYIGVTGAGYSVYGVTVGMDLEAARQLLADAGLHANGETFEHPDGGDGFDSCINLDAKNGRVTGIDWSTYTD